MADPMESRTVALTQSNQCVISQSVKKKIQYLSSNALTSSFELSALLWTVQLTVYVVDNVPFPIMVFS